MRADPLWLVQAGLLRLLSVGHPLQSSSVFCCRGAPIVHRVQASLHLDGRLMSASLTVGSPRSCAEDVLRMLECDDSQAMHDGPVWQVTAPDFLYLELD
jgi:hypothetical protein